MKRSFVALSSIASLLVAAPRPSLARGHSHASGGHHTSAHHLRPHRAHVTRQFHGTSSNDLSTFDCTSPACLAKKPKPH